MHSWFNDKLLFLGFILFLVMEKGGAFAQHWNSLNGIELGGNVTTVYDFCHIGDSLIVAGAWSYLDGSAQYGTFSWNGESYHPFGELVEAGVQNVVEYQNGLVISGDWLDYNNIPGTTDIVAWDGENFHSFYGGGDWPTGFGNDDVIVFKDSLFICGLGGGIPGLGNLSGIVGFNGSNWYYPGGLSSSSLKCMEVFKDELYVGGLCGYELGSLIPMRNIARYDGSEWHSLNGGFYNGYVTCMTVDEDEEMLYVGGWFSKTWDGLTAYNIVGWDGEQWHSIGVPAVNSAITSMCFYRDQLYVSGIFTYDQYDNQIYHIARWDGANWQPLQGGLEGAAFAMTVFNDELYVGGGISWVGDSTFTVSDVARWYMHADSVTWGVPVPHLDKDDIDDQSVFIQESDRPSSWKLFPNPTDDILHIEFELPQSGAVVITDLQGRQKHYELIRNCRKLDLNTSEFRSGNYLVNLVQDGTIVRTQRFIVN